MRKPPARELSAVESAELARPANRPPKLAEVVARDIVADIAAAGWKPGERLPPESAMVARFKVGRASLREALRILEIQGIVRLKPGPGGGPVVAAEAVQDYARMSTLHFQMRSVTYDELLSARLMLESMMARLAAERVDERSRQLLGDHLALEASLGDEDDRLFDIWADFHELLGALCGNGVMSLFAATLQEIHRDRVLYAERPASGATLAQRTRAEHKAIAKAIIAGKPGLAERLTREHVDRFQDDRWRGVAKTIITWT
jgi:GntR family transcriptional regulator, transcriptional repressor for pyruvate dehydrogenase complex